MDDAELLVFENHPVTPYDPHYTRDISLFRCVWDDYVLRMRQLVAAVESKRQFADLIDRYSLVLAKIHKFERATRVTLISYVDSRGRMRQNRSYIRDLL